MTVTEHWPLRRALRTLTVSPRETKATWPSTNPALTTVACARPDAPTVLTTARWFASRNGSASVSSRLLPSFGGRVFRPQAYRISEAGGFSPPPRARSPVGVHNGLNPDAVCVVEWCRHEDRSPRNPRGPRPVPSPDHLGVACQRRRHLRAASYRERRGRGRLGRGAGEPAVVRGCSAGHRQAPGRGLRAAARWGQPSTVRTLAGEWGRVPASGSSRSLVELRCATSRPGARASPAGSTSAAGRTVCLLRGC